MRKFVALVAAAAIGLLAACSSQPTSTDPYQVVDQASHATYGDLVQVNLGVDVAGAQPVHVDPSAIQLVVDTKSGKADVAVSLPIDALQLDAATRAQMGLTGSTLDLDIRYDGTALYTKSPLLQPLLTALVAGSGGTPGDYSGWVRLGTTAELAALAGGLVPQVSIPPLASGGPIPSHDAASLKADLESAGDHPDLRRPRAAQRPVDRPPDRQPRRFQAGEQPHGLGAACQPARAGEGRPGPG